MKAIARSTTMLSILKSATGAFTSLSLPRSRSRAAFRLGGLMRQMSSSGMPYDDTKMPFYALGVNVAKQVGSQIKTLVDEEELDIMLEGFSDTMRGTSLHDGNAILSKYAMALNQVITERSNTIVDRTKAAGADFIANFLDCNEEALQTESGLVYCSIKEGNGMQPSSENTVEVHYHGTLIDGTVFDSSVQRGQTISFPLSNVIRGWQEGLAMMKEGGKATLVIPSDLAYGDNGSGDVILPGATLVFEVELFKVN